MLCISGSLELVLWYCNNFYSNFVLFKVRNVVTSLLRLVIVVENYVTTDHQIRSLPSRQQIRREKMWMTRIPSHKHDR